MTGPATGPESEPGPLPTPRWFEHAGSTGYATKFAELVETGQDVEGEARLADALLSRGSRVLDAGAGMGRITAALRERGHTVTGVEVDPALVDQAARTYPGIGLLTGDILEVSGDWLAARGAPGEYDLVLLVGNVLHFVAPGTETTTLRLLADVLAPGGRLLVGFHLVGGPAAAHPYPVEDFLAHVEAAGLVVQARFATYELHPAGPADDFAVWLLGPA